MEAYKIIHDMGSGVYLALGIVAGLLGIVFVIHWFLLPFGIFGIRDRLDRVLIQLADLQRQLEKMEGVAGRSGVESKHTLGNAANPGGSRREAKCPHCDQLFEIKDVPLGTPQQCSHCHKPIYNFET